MTRSMVLSAVSCCRAVAAKVVPVIATTSRTRVRISVLFIVISCG